ncbi:3-deoxy-D-arabinoheptulosonate-7-phosphate synthase [Marivirga sericea]|uniref:3-deoxy-D-arabinoheptulosonate-7-phosphate synthase n=1 Tax=Marivirga sericea TaxID=1028 RepID=A0A1X7KEY3_9BACT|nr:3-deoxy-7-phosphoheptulonate synthase [Marivirga sericea]SMG39845.1 3-deoxy-D-arabinoheptulosonate-7-phosphate synthase [Marivirga sericea]
MIIHLNKDIKSAEAAKIAEQIKAFHIHSEGTEVLITSSSVKELPSEVKGKTEEHWVFANDMQLASREYRKETREVQFGNVSIGGNTKNTILISGPCSVESEEQIQQSAELLKSLNLTTLRGGCYKPRTSPYSFQGLGLEGLHLLAKMREEHGLKVITEARDATHIDEVIEHSDIIQIGAKAMYDQGILRACAKANKPVLLKRGFGSTLQEFVQAAEFLLSGGNDQVVLCERGIRTFETKTRFTLDLCGVAYLQEYTNLPVILDPSHALGYRYGIEKLTKACVAMGVDGLLVEAHPNPSVAKSDAAQQLTHEALRALKTAIEPVAKSVGYNIV